MSRSLLLRVRCLSAIGFAALLAASAQAQLVVDYNFTSNSNVPDNGQYSDTRTLGGLSSFDNVISRINLGSASGDTMWLGDMYSTLTFGNAGEGPRTAVLLNRAGVDNLDAFGNSLSSLNVTFADTASDNVWGPGTTSTGTYRPDARDTVNPYAAGVAFSDTGTANMAALQGSSYTSGKFSLLVADTAGGAAAKLNGWGMTLTGTAASSGNMTATSTGTMSISDVNSSSTNNLGSTVDTTQNGSGGTLNVTIAGTATFSGAVTGSGAFNKQGGGTLSLSGNNTYSGATTVGGGHLLVNGDSSGAAGAVSVASTAVLGGIGTIGGATTVNNGGKITGASNGSGSIGTLTLSQSLAIATGGIFYVDLSGLTADRLNIGGLLDLSASGDAITFDVNSSLTGTSYTLATFASRSGTFNTVNDLPDNYQLVYSDTDLQLVQITAVPEPGTYAAGALAAVSMLAFARRRIVARKALATA